jgi:hypothetical protein
MDELYRRALIAYFRYSAEPSPDQPAESCSGVEVHDGSQYVVLRNGHRLLSVYRVRNDGQLKRLKRWPGSITAA